MVTEQLAPGLWYQGFDYKQSHVHVLGIELTQREVRPVLTPQESQFPFKMQMPIKTAIAEDALASVGGGFNMQWSHGQGVSDQPLHAFSVDYELWTTGIGAGGYGLLLCEDMLGSRYAYVQQNHLETHIWRKDHTALKIDSVNLKHDGKAVMFTPRGGTNDVAMQGKYYTLLVTVGSRIRTETGEYHQTMKVEDVTKFIRPIPDTSEPGWMMIESRWPAKMKIGDFVTYTQRLGAPGVRHQLSGWPGIVRGGENVVSALDLHGVASVGPDNWFIRKNPRMAIGVSQDHKTIYMFVVEGRIPGSVGLRLKELATLMVRHGVYDAVNFDGGGSAFMWTSEAGLVADSCYGDGTIDGLRPDHWATAVF